jgi:nicotinamide riboside transporter PnuC
MSQAVAGYIWLASDVLLICWFGTQLTQHVRQNGLLLILLTLIIRYFHNVYRASNKLRNCGPF